MGIAAQAKSMRDIAQSFGRSIRQARGQLKRETPLPFSAPKSLFNKPVYATRNLGVGTTGIDPFKRMAKGEAVSVNEVALTILGGAATLFSKSPLADYIPPLTSVNVSNFAGPSYRCYLSDAEKNRPPQEQYAQNSCPLPLIAQCNPFHSTVG